MKSVKRLLAFGLVALSGLLVLACIWMWVMRPRWQIRAHWPSGTIRTHTDGVRVVCDEAISRLLVDGERDSILYSVYPVYKRRADHDANPTMMDWVVQDDGVCSRPFGVQVLGYSSERYHQRLPGVPMIPWFTHVMIELPWWFLTAASASPAMAIAFLQIRKGRRAARLAHEGECACGYSRVGLNDGAPCPECGTPGLRSPRVVDSGDEERGVG